MFSEHNSHHYPCESQKNNQLNGRKDQNLKNSGIKCGCRGIEVPKYWNTDYKQQNGCGNSQECVMLFEKSFNWIHNLFVI